MRARMIAMFVLAASLLAVSQVWGQSDGSVTVAGGFWNQDNPEAKYQEYRELPRGGYLANYVLRQFTGDWAMGIWGDTPTRHDQKNTMYLAKGVTWRLDADFSAVPHNFSFVSKTPFAENKPGVFTLPDSVQRIIQYQATAAANASLKDLFANGHSIPLGVNTDVTKARFRARPTKEMQFEIKASDRERSGHQALGATYGGPGGPAFEMPATIDQRTIDLDATGTYATGPMKASASVGYSSFHNRIGSLVYDMPRYLSAARYYTDAGGVYAMSTAPDNDVYRARLVGSYDVTPLASTVTATFGFSQTTQDQNFPLMTVNPRIQAISKDSLVMDTRGLNGKVNDMVADLRIAGRPISGLYYALRVRQEKSDDKTPVHELKYGFVNYDYSWSRSAVETEATSSKKTVAGLDADYTVNKMVTVSVLAERRLRDLPDWREVAKDAENVFGGSVRVRPMDNAEAKLGVQFASRKMDEFIVDAYDGAEWPDFRRFDVADRDQTKYNGMLSWSPDERLDLQVNGWYAKDDYKNSTWGLKSSDNTQFFGEGTLHLVKDLDVSGGFGYGEQKSVQASIENGTSVVADTTARAPWTATFKDKSVYAFGQADYKLNKQVEFVLDYTFTRDMQTHDFSQYFIKSKSNISPNPLTVTAIDWPNVFYRTNDVVLTAKWHQSAQTEFSCAAGYTKYDATDLLYQNIPYVNINTLATTASAASAYFLGNNRMNYKATRLTVAATRHF